MTLTELLVKYATFLINFDDRRARVISDNSASGVTIVCALLGQWHISGVLLGQRIFMSNSDMRVN